MSISGRRAGERVRTPSGSEGSKLNFVPQDPVATALGSDTVVNELMQHSNPSYLRLLRTGELAYRVERLESLLERCTVCPLDCGNNRLNDELARCYSGKLPIVSSYTPHFGEE